MFSRTLPKLLTQDVRCKLSARRKTCTDKKNNNNDTKVKDNSGEMTDDRSWTVSKSRMHQLDRTSKLNLPVPLFPWNAISFQLLCDGPYGNSQYGADKRLLGQVSAISGNWKASTNRWMLPSTPVKNLLRHARTTSGERPPRRDDAPVSYPKEKGFFRSANDPWLEKTRQKYKEQYAEAASRVHDKLRAHSKSPPKKVEEKTSKKTSKLETEIMSKALATPALSQIPRQQNELRSKHRYTTAKSVERPGGTGSTEKKQPKKKPELRSTSVVYTTKRKKVKSLLQRIQRSPLKNQIFLKKDNIIQNKKNTLLHRIKRSPLKNQIFLQKNNVAKGKIKPPKP